MRSIVALLLLAACSGCPHPPKPPLPPYPAADLALAPDAGPTACTAPIGRPVPCDGLFHVQTGSPCASCPGNDGCYYAPGAFYCVHGSCFIDPACTLQPPDTAARRKR